MDPTDLHPPRAEQAVALALDGLEHLASSDWLLACGRMVALYPIADAIFVHDVCDRIDLWIANKGLPPSLADRLREMIALESDDGLKRHYQGWLGFADPIGEDPREHG